VRFAGRHRPAGRPVRIVLGEQQHSAEREEPEIPQLTVAGDDIDDRRGEHRQQPLRAVFHDVSDHEQRHPALVAADDA
jgi:hypothetical protein